MPNTIRASESDFSKRSRSPRKRDSLIDNNDHSDAYTQACVPINESVKTKGTVGQVQLADSATPVVGQSEDESYFESFVSAQFSNESGSSSSSSGRNADGDIEGDGDDGQLFQDLLWVAVACGYMAPWTSLGSLISYFKATFGPKFYVKLYCAYYLPGLPTSLLQQFVDHRLDGIYGSKNTYLVRGVLSYVGLASTLAVLPYVATNGAVLLILTGLLGVCTWYLHGCACSLCCMFPERSTAFLQTGFRMPEVTVLLLVSVMQIGTQVSLDTMIFFFYITMALTFGGLLAWIFVVRSRPALKQFELKDRSSRAHDSAHKHTGTASAALDDEEAIGSETSPLLACRPAILTPVAPVYQPPKRFRPLQVEKCQYQSMSSTLSPNHFLSRSHPKNSCLYPLMPETAMLLEEFAIDNNSSKKVPTALQFDANAVALAVWPYRAALFITIWSSIVTAAFFVYVSSSVPGRNIEQILYFVRLFSDLMGRPLARVWRPAFIIPAVSRTQCPSSPGWHGLLVLSVGRLVLMGCFFAYMKWGQACSDVLVCVLVGLFSLLSGYVCVLSYERAASVCTRRPLLPNTDTHSLTHPTPSDRRSTDSHSQAYCAGLLNTSFQAAAFTAVATSVLVATSPLFA